MGMMVLSAYNTVHAETLDPQNSLANTQVTRNTPQPATTTATNTNGNHNYNHNHGGNSQAVMTAISTINPQTIITTIEDIITIIEAISNFVHSIHLTSNTTTSTSVTANSKLAFNKPSNDEIEKMKNAYGLFKANILKIFEEEENMLGK